MQVTRSNSSQQLRRCKYFSLNSLGFSRKAISVAILSAVFSSFSGVVFSADPSPRADFILTYKDIPEKQQFVLPVAGVQIFDSYNNITIDANGNNKWGVGLGLNSHLVFTDFNVLDISGCLETGSPAIALEGSWKPEDHPSFMTISNFNEFKLTSWVSFNGGGELEIIGKSSATGEKISTVTTPEGSSFYNPAKLYVSDLKQFDLKSNYYWGGVFAFLNSNAIFENIEKLSVEHLEKPLIWLEGVTYLAAGIVSNGFSQISIKNCNEVDLTYPVGIFLGVGCEINISDISEKLEVNSALLPITGFSCDQELDGKIIPTVMTLRNIKKLSLIANNESKWKYSVDALGVVPYVTYLDFEIELSGMKKSTEFLQELFDNYVTPTISLWSAKDATTAPQVYIEEVEEAELASQGPVLWSTPAARISLDVGRLIMSSNYSSLPDYKGIGVYSGGKNSKIIIKAGDASDIQANILAEEEGEIDLTLAGSTASMTAWTLNKYDWTETEPSNPGLVKIKLTDGATWHVTEDSFLDELNLSNGGHLSHVLKAKTRNADNQSRTTVTVAHLTTDSTGGQLTSRVDFVPDPETGLGKTDHLIITESASGSHKINIAGINTENFSEENPPIERSDYIVRDASNGSKWELNTTTKNTIDVGNLEYVYEITSEPNDNNGTDWYLVNTEKLEKPQFSPAAEAVLAMAGLGSQHMTYLAGLTDLRKRLGEVRMTTQSGIWAQVSADKSRLSGLENTLFKQTQYRFNIGIDYKLSNWMIGANFKYSNSNQKTYDGLYRAKGDAHSYGLNLYGTWFSEKGSYVDIVGTVDKYHDRLSSSSLTNEPLKASFRNLGLGISIEGGHKFTFRENKDLFLEPQLQLSYYYVKGDKFTVSNGMTVQQDNFNSLTARLGAVAGKDWFSADGDKFAQVSVKAGLKQGFFGKQKIKVNDSAFKDDFGGTRVYYGLGADWQMRKNLKFYTQIEREHGKHYTKEIEASIGLKYQF